MINWEIHGLEFGNCNCSYGCPCQFNALPTHGNCRAVAFFRIDRGRFGDVKLDGLKCGLAAKWPGAVHEGPGAQHRVGIVMPNGFEFTVNEVGRGWSHSTGKVEIELENSYAHWCELHMNNDGLIRERRATVAA